MKRTLNRACMLVMLSLSLAAQAGGLHLYEIGTSDLGLAAAGTAARAEDASTVYTNPAGMTRLSGHQISFGAQALYANAPYTQANGTNIGNVSGLRPDANLFYSHSVSDRLKLGIGIYGNYGLSLDFGKQWAGHSLVAEAELKAASVQPTMAYKLNEQWSLGGGLVASYGYAKLNNGVAGTVREQSDENWAYGARLGLLYEPSKNTRFGLTWQSKIVHRFDMHATIAAPPGLNIYPAALNQGVRPEEAMFSMWHRLNDRWTVMGNLGWQGWSAFTNAAMEIRRLGAYPGVLTPLATRDTWHAALGAQYQWDARTKLNFGVAYDSSFYKSQDDISVLLPNGKVWRIGTGLQYALTPKDELGFAVGYLRTQNGRDQSMNYGPGFYVAGSYSQPQIYFMSVHYSHKF